MAGKLFAILLLGLGLVNASPIAKRSVASDITTITTDVQKLDKDITGWDGTLLNALPLLTDVDTIKTDINTAITDTNSSSAFSSSDSTTVTSEVVALQPIIATTLSDLADKVCLSFRIRGSFSSLFCKISASYSLLSC
jgi:hypothetical protein